MSAPICNLLCIWYTLELKRYSDIDESHFGGTTAAIYERTKALIA
jgi:hypothetical protein